MSSNGSPQGLHHHHLHHGNPAPLPVAASSSGKATRGHDSLPQSYKSSDDSSPGAEQVEYDGLLVATAGPRKKNCCTWKVASVFLAFVAVGLVLTWQLLPTEDIVAKYIPEFEEPANPYYGPEAGDSSSGGGGSENESGGGDNGGGGITIGMPPSQTPANNEVVEAGITVPSFMKCPEDGELCCNGSVKNCKLKVDEMMFGLVHNSMSSEEGDFFFGFNHYLGLEKSLVAGYRALNLDVCNCGGVLQFCHNVCDLGERYPNDVFGNVVKFLDDYPSEVVILLFQASQEKGPIIWNNLHDEMDGVDGFTEMIYQHTDGEEWPTMGQLVKQNKRIIVFYFNGGECVNEVCPDDFHYFYNYAAETQFDSKSLDDLQNYEYSCEITRGPKAGAKAADFFVVNNFVTPPDPEASKLANSQSFLSERLTKCANMNQMRPNFVYLDFFSRGVTAQFVQSVNAQFSEQLE